MHFKIKKKSKTTWRHQISWGLYPTDKCLLKAKQIFNTTNVYSSEEWHVFAVAVYNDRGCFEGGERIIKIQPKSYQTCQSKLQPCSNTGHSQFIKAAQLPPSSTDSSPGCLYSTGAKCGWTARDFSWSIGQRTRVRQANNVQFVELGLT